MKKKLLSLALTAALCLSLAVPALAAGGFADVPADAYYAQAVAWAVEQGVTAGTSETTFSPDQTCTQGQILTFLWRAKGQPAPAGATGGEYYAAPLQWAKEQGIVGADVSPEAPCTRAHVVTYLWKLAGSPDAAGGSFADVPADADYAQAVSWAVEQSVTSGTSETAFSPDQTCTRGQIVTFLYRALVSNPPAAQPVDGGAAVEEDQLYGTYQGGPSSADLGDNLCTVTIGSRGFGHGGGITFEIRWTLSPSQQPAVRGSLVLTEKNGLLVAQGNGIEMIFYQDHMHLTMPEEFIVMNGDYQKID